MWDMTLMPGGAPLLKIDAKGRVWTPAEKRAEILREFDSSGASGVEFARLIGVKYPTFAGWIRRRGSGAAGARRRGRPPSTRPAPTTVQTLSEVSSSPPTLPTPATGMIEEPEGSVQTASPGSLPQPLFVLFTISAHPGAIVLRNLR